MAETADVYTPVRTAEAAFQNVAVLQAEEAPDLPLLEFAARLVQGAGGGRLTVAAFSSAPALRSLPAAVKRCARICGLREPEVLLITEPGLEGVFSLTGEVRAGLLVMRCPRRISRRVLARCAYSVCLVPPEIPKAVSRILVSIGLDAAGRHVLRCAGRLASALQTQNLVALHIQSPEAVVCEPFSTGKEWRDLLHFLHRASPRGVSCTPLLEGSARPVETLARVAAECGADLVVFGRGPGEVRTYDLLRLAEDVSVPVMQLRLPQAARGMRARLLQMFSHPEPLFG